MNLSGTFKTVKSVITANSPVLLTGAAIVGVVTTGVLAAKAGYKARGILDEASNGHPETLEFKKQVELTWLCYAAPGVTAISTIASVAGVHLIHNKRQAALAGLYAMTATKLDDVREEAEELLGAKKTQQLNDAVAQRAVDRADSSNELILVEGGTELCYEELSGRWFMTSVPMLERAVAEVNTEIVEEGEAELNSFYQKIGIGETELGGTHGWRKKFELKIGTTKTPEGKAALSFWFLDSPKPINSRR